MPAAPFLLAEDNAIKALLKGMTVSDQNNATRPVGVWFRLPEAEEREMAFPAITIDLADIEEEHDRSHRGPLNLPYLPYGVTAPPAEQDHKTDWPIPVALIYSITTHCRSAWHDRQLQAALLTTKLPFRHGSLLVPTATNGENTIRRLDFLGVDALDGFDANGKRVFRKVYTVLVSSELWAAEITAVKRVSSIEQTVEFQTEIFEVAP